MQPYFTASLPGIGGTLKQVPEDFVVDEIPAYEPSGTGEHLFLWIEKREFAAEQLTRHIVRTLRCANQDVGVAGLKDKFAVTRQFISIPAKFAELVPQLETEQIRVLRAERHGNKLRTGHLKGNRFQIVVRELSPGALEKAEAIAAVIGSQGFPNYYGDQRFGRDRETWELGRAMLTGTKSPREIPFARRKFLLRLAISAVQSQLFNDCLAVRLNDGLLRTVLPGDVMEVVASGGKFIVEAVDAEQTRADAGEITVTGPMFGPRMLPPRHTVAEREQAVLLQSGLLMEQFASFGEISAGTRRAYLIHPGDIRITPMEGDETALRFEFTLPAGVYATTFLREFQKQDESQPANLETEPMQAEQAT